MALGGEKINSLLSLPEIPDSERTPLMDVLLGIIEALSETIQRHDEEMGSLKDEIAILKGEKRVRNSNPVVWRRQPILTRRQQPATLQKSGRARRNEARLSSSLSMKSK
jgi:hypothetical protein